VITDEDVMRLFERADPARHDDVAPVMEATGYLDALQARSTYVIDTETIRPPNRPASRRRWPIIAAAAAGVVIVAGVITLAVRDDPDGGSNEIQVTDDGTTPPTTPETTPATTPATPESVATGFLEAYGNHDQEQAAAYLADDADVDGLFAAVGTQLPGATVQDLRRVEDWLAAVGYEHRIDACEPRDADPAAPRFFHCEVEYQSLRSAALGLGPYPASFDLTVSGGEVTEASMTFGLEEFSVEVWEPFSQWVLTNHPEDAGVMYQDDSFSAARLTPASIRRWAENTQDYVDAQAAATSRGET
jgi:hypothetical protein